MKQQEEVLKKEVNSSEDMFANSKLFNQALSQQSSHYIQTKLMSLPKEAQDLKKLDLRHMCDTVVKELELVEKEAAYDYIKVSEELETLGEELTIADNIMEELENVLYNFKDHLESIKSEMTSLQDKSNKMNTSLSNKKKVQGLLNSFIESAVLDKELIDAICLAEINDGYVQHIKALLKKLSYLNSNLIAPDSKAVKELQPQLQKLKARASVRLRQFLLEQISQLKKPKINVQIMQKNVLGKYKVFTEFFKDQYPQIYTQLCNNYREIMAKIYLTNFKIYLQEIYKLQTQLYLKTDQLLPLDPQHMRLFLTQIKPTNLNQDKRSIYSLMSRERIIQQNQSNDVILYNVASQKGQKFTIEQIFKSVNKALMDGVLFQVIFTAEFFNIKSEGAVELFGPIFRPSLDVFLGHIKNTVSSTFDIFGLLTILAINEKNRINFNQKDFTALDFYFDQVRQILWPKFQELFEFHMKSLQNYTPAMFKKLQKSSSTKIIVDRFADFFASYYRLFIYFPDTKMMGVRLESIRKCFFDLIKKVCSQFEREIEGFSYYLKILEQFHFTFTSDGVICKFKEFHNYQIQLEKEISFYAEKIVGSYIKDFFVSMDGFIKKYCKAEGTITEESALSIQGTVDSKTIDATIGDLSNQSFVSKLQKLLQFCQKMHSGYSLKLILKKFMGIFMKYYNEIYKYIKNSHGQAINMMLQPHNMMKEIKNSFSKYNV